MQDADVEARIADELRTKTPGEIQKLKGSQRRKARVRNELNETLAAASGGTTEEKATGVSQEVGASMAAIVLSAPLVTYEQFKKTLGRPPTYVPTKHPAMIFELMAPPYCFTKEVAGMRLGIHRNTVYEWMDKYNEFGDACRAGMMLAEEFHAGRLGSGTVKYAQGLIFYMKNRFAWKDKSEIEHSRKVDDLVKEGDTDANRVDWKDIAPSSSGVSGVVIDAEVIDEDDDG